MSGVHPSLGHLYNQPPATARQPEPGNVRPSQALTVRCAPSGFPIRSPADFQPPASVWCAAFPNNQSSMTSGEDTRPANQTAHFPSGSSHGTIIPAGPVQDRAAGAGGG